MSGVTRARRGRVLVLGRDTRAFLSVVRSLGRHGLDVHVGWCDARAAAVRSRYAGTRHDVPPPSLQHLEWRDRLLELLEREHFDLVIPCNDPSILPLQLRKEDFGRFLGAMYLLEDEAFRIAFDKLESHDLARSLGIRVPRRVRVCRLADVGAVTDSFAFPVVVKPRASFTADRLASKHHVRWARSPQELQSLVQALLPWGDVAVEERVGGRGAGVEVLAHQGEVLACFQHLRLHEPPGGGGSSYRCSTELDPELVAATRRFLAALRYTGVAMLEFKVDPERGTWAFIEINARFWGSLPLALAAGADFPAWLYQMWVEGRRDFPSGYRTGVRCRNLVLDVRWTKRNWQASRSDPALTTVPRWRMAADLVPLLTLREHTDTFVLDDPWPGMAEVRDGLRRGLGWVARAVTRSLRHRSPGRRRRAALAHHALRRADRVLFVCKGNVCRSPFAHRLAQQVAPPDLQIASGGYHPQPGRSCPPEAVRVADEMGIDLRTHRSRLLSAAMVDDADVILVFDDDNYRTLRHRYGWAMSKVHLLGSLGDRRPPVIPDPDGGSLADFRMTYEAIRQSITSAFRPAPGGTTAAATTARSPGRTA
jgi:protein-tyrosine-phosphatase/predicted ATP-grasp superfamily ATP-dependent carboligase